MWNSLIGQVYTGVMYVYVWWIIKFDDAVEDMSEWMKIRK